MSHTAFRANAIKQQLQNIRPALKEGDPIHKTMIYVIDRLWPELEDAIKEELPEPNSN